MRTETKTTHITITETTNNNPLVDTTSALNIINQATDILDILLKVPANTDDDPINTETLLAEISHLLFSAQMHLGEFDEYTEVAESFD